MRSTVAAALMCWVVGLSQASHITLERSPANVRLTAPRSPDLPLHLQVDAFNQDHQLSLKKAPSPFAANFKLQQTARDDQDRLVLQEVEVEESNLATIYHNPDTGTVISVDGSNVEGLLTPSMTIKASVDGNHYAVRQLSAPTPPHFPVHITDYLEIPQNLRNKEKASSSPRGVVSVKPELYVIIDSTLASSLGSNKKVKQYLGIFWNAVNHRFATMSDPKVQVVLSGALIVRKSSDEPYINENILTQNYIHGENSLGSVSDWLYQKKGSLPAYDLAYLMTGKDMADVENGQLKEGLAGIAWRGAACVVASGNKRSFNTGMGEDMGVYYSGVMTAAHELAHNLGAPHDGSDGAEGCSWDLGYIMSYIAGNRNKLFFSPCSQQLMKNYISSGDAACLRSTLLGSKIPLSGKLPGQVVSMDEQCQKSTGKSGAYASKSASEDSLCVQLECQWQQKQGRYTYTYTQKTGRPAAEGSPCKSGGACTNGACQ